MGATQKLPPNSVGWHILEGYPWWPVFICDAFKLRTNLHQLGAFLALFVHMYASLTVRLTHSLSLSYHACVPTCEGSGHRQVQRKAREYPNDYALVYFFGTHNLYVRVCVLCLVYKAVV